METHITSEVAYTVPVHKEYSQLVTDAHKGMLWRRLGLLLCAAYLCYGMLAIRIPFLNYLVLLLSAYLLFTGWRNQRKYKDGDPSYQEMLKGHGGKLPHNIIFLEEDGLRFHNPDTGNDKDIPYSSVRYILESENLLVLMTDLNLGVSLDKRTLQNGTREDVLAWVYHHCPKCKQKIRTGKSGQLLVKACIALMALAALLSISSLTGLTDRLMGRMTDRMSYSQMAEGLQELGITISQQTLDQLSSQEDQENKLLHLLRWEGSGTFEEATQTWVPSGSGVFWITTDGPYQPGLHTDLLRGVDALSEELTFTQIWESDAMDNPGNWDYRVDLTFCLNGQEQALESYFSDSWYFPYFFQDLGILLDQDELPGSLWIYRAQDGILLFYGNEDQVKALEKKTLLHFFDCAKALTY